LRDCLELKGAGLADMRKREARIRGDGAVERCHGTRIHGQQKVDAFNVSIARGSNSGG
jgi:hypothetical protein